VPVDEEVVDLGCGGVFERVLEAEPPARDDNHLGGNAPLGTKLPRQIEAGMETRWRRASRLAYDKYSGESGLDEPPDVGVPRHANLPERRLPERLQGIRISPIG